MNCLFIVYLFVCLFNEAVSKQAMVWMIVNNELRSYNLIKTNGPM